MWLHWISIRVVGLGWNLLGRIAVLVRLAELVQLGLAIVLHWLSELVKLLLAVLVLLLLRVLRRILAILIGLRDLDWLSELIICWLLDRVLLRLLPV